MKKPKVRVFYDKILTTVNTKKMQGNIILTSNERGEILTRQTVVACGPNSNVEVGDDIEINVELFQKRRIPAKNDVGPDNYELIPPIEMIGKEYYLFITSREVKWVYEKDKENQTVS